METLRLRGERLRLDHAEALLPIQGDPRVMATLATDGQPLSLDQIRESLQKHARHWEEYGFGFYLFLCRRTGDVVARGGLYSQLIDGVREVELGWAVRPDRWGQGYATEVGRASLDLVLNDLGIGNPIGLTRPDNAASRRVMEKLRLRYERPLVHRGLPQVLYRYLQPGEKRRKVRCAHC